MTQLEKCRISGDPNLVPVIDLGPQELTGVFPKTADTPITCAPLDLVWSPESQLLQLNHSPDLSEMYGLNYGYRSGLNQAMVAHLSAKVGVLEQRYGVSSGDCVIDIGSNDATTLKSYKTPNLTRIGVDPTGVKFQEFYPSEITLIPEFFPSRSLERAVGHRRVKLITSIAMFYDLEDPVGFARAVAQMLDRDGIWHLEQSYMPAMIRLNSYDTICHEHLEYYSMFSLKYVMDQADLRILDVTMNAVNGGSFAITACRRDSSLRGDEFVVDWLLEREARLGFDSPRPFRDFQARAFEHRAALRSLIASLKAERKTVLGYGASTKGNVVLQFCGFGPDDISCIAEINPDKFGALTPGTHIPIVSAAEAAALNPDYYLVLPWHFRPEIIRRESAYLAGGGKLIFPFPEIEIVGA